MWIVSFSFSLKDGSRIWGLILIANNYLLRMVFHAEFKWYSKSFIMPPNVSDSVDRTPRIIGLMVISRQGHIIEHLLIVTKGHAIKCTNIM